MEYFTFKHKAQKAVVGVYISPVAEGKVPGLGLNRSSCIRVYRAGGREFPVYLEYDEQL